MSPVDFPSSSANSLYGSDPNAKRWACDLCPLKILSDLRRYFETPTAIASCPAKSSFVKIDEENRKATVTMKGDQIALAIGKGGVNIKLARQLTGYDIEVFSEDVEMVEDVMLDDFSDEIDSWIIEIFKSIGLDSAKSVLSVPMEELVSRTDLEEETIEEVFRILGSEFE